MSEPEAVPQSGTPDVDWLEHASESLEYSRDLVLLVDRSGTIRFANRAWREALGYLREELRGVSLFDVVQWHDHAACQAWLERSGRDDAGVWVRLVFVSRQGAEIPVEGMTSSRPDGNGAILQGVFRNVSEQRRAEIARKESEERFRLLSTHAPVGVFQTDAQGRLTYTNARWRWMAGLSDIPDPRGVWWQAVHPEDRDRVLREWQSALRHGHEFSSEFRIRSGPGSVRWARTRVAQVCGPDGGLRSCIGITEDITDHKRIEAELAAARDAALEAVSLKSQFLANMSHEIRTPMNGVIGLLDLLLDTTMDAQQRRFAETARDSACQLLTILNDILDLSRIEAGKLTIEPSLFSLRGAAEACVNFLAPKAIAKGLRLTAVVDPRLPDRLWGDSGRLRQVLANLVGNAVKFTERGQVELSVTRRSTAGSALVVQFSVRDTGIGIPADAVDRLFRPFVQLDGSATRRFGGTGLGLAICRQLVEMMGGEIGVESQPGEGSHFWFSLPLGLPAEGEVPAAEAAATPTAAGSATGSTPAKRGLDLRDLRVLIAEDNAVNLKVALWQLDKLGCQARSVTNGRDLVKAVEQEWFDLLIIDCQMPELDGFEAARQVRALEANRRAADPSLPPIYLAALTAHAMAGDRDRCLAAGMDDYVSKPARSSDFEALLRRCLERRR